MPGGGGGASIIGVDPPGQTGVDRRHATPRLGQGGAGTPSSPQASWDSGHLHIDYTLNALAVGLRPSTAVSAAVVWISDTTLPRREGPPSGSFGYLRLPSASFGYRRASLTLAPEHRPPPRWIWIAPRFEPKVMPCRRSGFDWRGWGGEGHSPSRSPKLASAVSAK